MKQRILITMIAGLFLTAGLSAQAPMRMDRHPLERVDKNRPLQKAERKLTLKERREFQRLTRMVKADGKITRGELKMLRNVRKRQLAVSKHLNRRQMHKRHSK